MEIILQWTNLTQKEQQTQMTARKKDEPFNMVLSNCTLDPIIFDVDTILSLTLDKCILTRPMWESRNVWPNLCVAIFTNCSMSNWRHVVDALPSGMEQLVFEHTKGDFSTTSLARFKSLHTLCCKNIPASNMLNTLIYKNGSVLEQKGQSMFADKLVSLTMDKCLLRQRDLPTLAKLDNLHHLSVADNYFVSNEEASVNCLSSLSNLRYLNVDGCALKEQCGIYLAYAIQRMPHLKTLYIGHNVGLRSIGLTYILNVLQENKGIETINVEAKNFEPQKRIRVDYKVWRKLDLPSKEWMEHNCRKMPNYVEKKGSQVSCYECFHAKEQHMKKCKECRADKACEVQRDMKCTHENKCGICFTEYDTSTPVMELGCHHVFCRSCLLEWTRKQRDCPTCRKEIVMD
jgi:hypothetical protein